MFGKCDSDGEAAYIKELSRLHMYSPTHRIHSASHLLIILLISIVNDVEESELIDTLGG
jgi:hypothetical protein